MSIFNNIGENVMVMMVSMLVNTNTRNCYKAVRASNLLHHRWWWTGVETPHWPRQSFGWLNYATFSLWARQKWFWVHGHFQLVHHTTANSTLQCRCQVKYRWVKYHTSHSSSDFTYIFHFLLAIQPRIDINQIDWCSWTIYIHVHIFFSSWVL